MFLKFTIWMLSFHALFSSAANPDFGINALSKDSQQLIKIDAFIDVYANSSIYSNAVNRPYAVSSNANRAFNVNLAALKIQYQSPHIRAVFNPGFGTYMNENYAAEPQTLQFLLEANIGIKLTKKKGVWLDAGVLPSPYSNESPISKDHLLYTRSLASEYVPYYLSGVKLSYPLGKKVNLYLYGVNGWQRITNNNQQFALGTQLEYKVNDNLLLNWNTFSGNENSKQDSLYFNRYFSDFYMIYKPKKGRWSFTTCAFMGIQNTVDTFSQSKDLSWWQVNAQFAYKISKKSSLSARVEYFADPDAVMLRSIRDEKGFDVYGGSLCLNIQIQANAMFRLEARSLQANQAVFGGTRKTWRNGDVFFSSSLSAWF